ncbi:hypothetical protein KKG31_04025 [Patescibacteria group bacterium]|nr:hypothetical protein [Patescibacteria group bacterium]MBU1758310.1 hypothetical protein [Patescibacteria group bacterium]
MNIPLKLSKKAVFRHIIKRAIVTYIQANDLSHNSLKESFYKIFIMVNKSSLPLFQKAIEKLDKKAIISLAQKEFEKAWQAFFKKIK